MNILMMTNTYTPIVGGLEKSVQLFTDEYLKRGHDVRIVAPIFPDMPSDEKNVIRVPAIQHFNGSDFSVHLPVPGVLKEALQGFKPDIVHAHHPFLIGDTALRVAYKFNAPLVFTYHTLYEQYSNYVPGDSHALKRFTVQLSTGFASLADRVFAPSESVKKILIEREVQTPIEVISTGISRGTHAKGDGETFRQQLGIPSDCFIVGCVGRLALEKNLEFLSKAVLKFLKASENSVFVVIGSGPEEKNIRRIFSEAGLSRRLFMAGVLKGENLANAYAALNVFAFASQSETQGMVLVEAMAAGVPVVAVDACGVRDVVENGKNGRLLPVEDEEMFAWALGEIANFTPEEQKQMIAEAKKTAEGLTMDICAEKALRNYQEVLKEKRTRHRAQKDSRWAAAKGLIRAEWDIFKNITKATGAVMKSDEEVFAKA